MKDNTYKGIVTDGELCKPLEGVSVSAFDSTGNIISKIKSNSLGLWQINSSNVNKIVFRLDGFSSKEIYSKNIPEMVRLIKNCLIGYQPRLWFLPGETVDVFIHSSEKYTAKLFRHGINKNCILNIGEYDTQYQTIPDGFFVEKGLEWEKSFSYEIPVNAVPGLYSLLLESDNQENFAIPMVVSTPEHRHGKQSKILVLASTNTWQSYNIWGGRSRYRNFEDGNSRDFLDTKITLRKRFTKILAKFFPSKIKKAVNDIFEKRFPPPEPSWFFRRLAIQRPITNGGLEEHTPFQPFTNHLAAGEWRLLAWLEREGIEYDFISGAELHKNPDILKFYKCIILSTHCEYWTKEMYRGMKQHHENNGLWILNISGNSIYREIGFFEDGSTQCRNLHFGRNCEDETQVTGVRFTMSDYGSCAPFKILKSDHWAFQNIPLSKSLTFGGLSLNQNTPKPNNRYDPGRPGIENSLNGMGASGWETDKLSDSAPKDITLIAKGLNDNGGADMVIRDPMGARGGMFSASSLTFSGCLLIDNVASMLVKNILERSIG